MKFQSRIFVTFPFKLDFVVSYDFIWMAFFPHGLFHCVFFENISCTSSQLFSSCIQCFILSYHEQVKYVTSFQIYTMAGFLDLRPKIFEFTYIRPVNVLNTYAKSWPYNPAKSEKKNPENLKNDQKTMITVHASL